MKIPGEGLPRVYLGINFLREIASETKVELGKKVIVVGGGDTAIDAARVAIRLGAEVTLVYRRTKREMPAHEREVEEAKEEGVAFHFLAAPVEIIGKDRVEKVRCIKMELGEPDASGRRRPIPVLGSEFDLLADSVIMAIGQRPDLDLIAKEGIQGNRKVAEVNESFQTNLKGVFAGGDLVLGPSTAVESIATGRKAAFAINAFLNHEKYEPEQAYNHKKEVSEADYKDRERMPKQQMPMLSPAERIKNFEPVELGFTEEQAKAEAKRCMECGCLDVFDCKLRKYAQAYGAVQDRFKGAVREFKLDDKHPWIKRDPNKCILCGTCVRLSNELHGEGVVDFAFRGLNAVVEPPFGESFATSKSKLLGDLVEFCPTGALVEKPELPMHGPWDCEKIKTLCVGCGIGCEINVDKIGNLPVKISKLEESWNEGHLCDLGKFKSLPKLERRINAPMIRANGKLKKVSLEEAIDFIGKRRRPIDILISPNTTLEEARLLKELAEKTGGKISSPIPTENSNATYKDFESAKEIYVDKEIFEEFPLLKILVKEKLEKGAKLVKKVEELSKEGIAIASSSRKLPKNILRIVQANGANSLGLTKLGIKREELSSPNLFAYGIDPIKEGVPIANKFLIVQSFSSISSTKEADVVLPMNSWIEKEGTLISTFGRVGKLRKVINSGIIDNWKLIQQIDKKFGVKKKYSSLEEITSCLRKELNF
jgi:ferredoxin